MIELLNKDTELMELLDSIEETKKGTLVRDLLNKAIQKAYTAGYLRTNVLEGTCQTFEQEEYDIYYKDIQKTSSLDFSDQVGEIRTLLNVYTAHNGY
jgi:hypothetical protein